MNNQRNLRLYRLYAPFYDLVMRPMTAGARRRAVAILAPRPGERVLIVGVGTGLDLPHFPPGVQMAAIDLSASMLQRTRCPAVSRSTALAQMDAQALAFAAGRFDGLLLSLVLTVVPDGAAALREVWRVLRPGGRAVVFDKFLPGRGSLSPVRRAVGRVIAALGTDPNRRLSDMTAGLGDLAVEHDEQSLLNGQYRILRLRKTAP